MYGIKFSTPEFPKYSGEILFAILNLENWVTQPKYPGFFWEGINIFI